ncbi:MAG: hypothetical protein AB1500_07305 [Bacillota bacterium]
MDKFRTSLVLCIILFSFITIFGCSSSTKSTSKSKEENKKEQVKAAQLATKYHAIDWEAQLESEDYMPLTIEVQDKLMNESSPFIFKDCMIDDIYRKQNETYATFYSIAALPDIILCLKLPPTTKERLYLSQKNHLVYNLVVAVNNVVKPEVRVEPSNTSDDEDTAINIDTNRTLLIYGDLMAFEPCD